MWHVALDAIAPDTYSHVLSCCGCSVDGDTVWLCLEGARIHAAGHASGGDQDAPTHETGAL